MLLSLLIIIGLISQYTYTYLLPSLQEPYLLTHQF